MAEMLCCGYYYIFRDYLICIALLRIILSETRIRRIKRFHGIRFVQDDKGDKTELFPTVKNNRYFCGLNY